MHEILIAGILAATIAVWLAAARSAPQPSAGGTAALSELAKRIRAERVGPDSKRRGIKRLRYLDLPSPAGGR